MVEEEEPPNNARQGKDRDVRNQDENKKCGHAVRSRLHLLVLDGRLRATKGSWNFPLVRPLDRSRCCQAHLDGLTAKFYLLLWRDLPDISWHDAYQV